MRPARRHAHGPLPSGLRKLLRRQGPAGGPSFGHPGAASPSVARSDAPVPRRLAGVRPDLEGGPHVHTPCPGPRRGARRAPARPPSCRLDRPGRRWRRPSPAGPGPAHPVAAPPIRRVDAKLHSRHAPCPATFPQGARRRAASSLRARPVLAPRRALRSRLTPALRYITRPYPLRRDTLSPPGPALAPPPPPALRRAPPQPWHSSRNVHRHSRGLAPGHPARQGSRGRAPSSKRFAGRPAASSAIRGAEEGVCTRP